MCGASVVALGMVLGHRRENILHLIYCASKDPSVAQKNFKVSEQELLAVFFTLKKF